MAFGGVYCGPASDILNPPGSTHLSGSTTPQRSASLRQTLRDSIRRTKTALSARTSYDLDRSSQRLQSSRAASPPYAPPPAPIQPAVASTSNKPDDAQQTPQPDPIIQAKHKPHTAQTGVNNVCTVVIHMYHLFELISIWNFPGCYIPTRPERGAHMLLVSNNCANNFHPDPNEYSPHELCLF